MWFVLKNYFIRVLSSSLKTNLLPAKRDTLTLFTAVFWNRCLVTPDITGHALAPYPLLAAHAAPQLPCTAHGRANTPQYSDNGGASIKFTTHRTILKRHISLATYIWKQRCCTTNYFLHSNIQTQTTLFFILTLSHQKDWLPLLPPAILLRIPAQSFYLLNTPKLC